MGCFIDGKRWQYEVQTHSIATNHLSVADSQAQHITTIEQGKVFSDRIHPNEVWELGVPHTDVARDAFCVAIPGPIAENSGHMHHNVFAMLIVRVELWNACKTHDQP